MVTILAPCTGHMTMTTDNLTPDALLTLAQWLSPAFPTGGFAYSQGLEWLVADGVVTDAHSYTEWLDTVLTQGAGRNDAILLAAAYAGDPADIDALARALSPSAERLLETVAQGTAFTQTVGAVWGIALPPLTLPVAVGAAAKAQGLPLPTTLRLYLMNMATALTGAAQRLVPLGQTAAQKVLALAQATCTGIADAALAASLDDLGAASFACDIASMRHEVQTTRLFRS